MRLFPNFVCFGLMLTLSCFSFLGCGSDGTAAGGAGGTAGSGGQSGGTGGIGGEGGSAARPCSVERDCDDEDPCTNERCVEQFCVSDPPQPDDAICVSDTGLSVCLAGACQLFRLSCTDEGAEEGDFCQPAVDVGRSGRCVSGACEVGPCEISTDCWDGDACSVGTCDESAGTCSQGNAPNGAACLPPAGGQCFDGVCGAGGGQGGAGGQGGTGGQGGA